MISPEKIKPLGKRALVKRSEIPASKGGILIPDSSKEKSKEGEVIAVGPGTLEKDGTFTPLEVQKGDRVLFGAFSGTEVDEDHLIISEDDLLIVIE